MCHILFFSASQKKLSQFKTIFNNSNSNSNHNHMGKKRQPSVEDEEEEEEKGLNMEEFEESESDEYDSDVRFIVEWILWGAAAIALSLR